MRAMTYLPKEKLGDVVPFLEDILKYEYLPGWKRLMEKSKRFFDSRFESDCEKRQTCRGRNGAKCGRSTGSDEIY
jgi:hypothetical protein